MKKNNLLILKAIIKSNNLQKYMRLFDVDNQFASIYPFATENIKGYLDSMDVIGKDILTVGASGDQTLNLLVNGAKTVDYFDVNPFAEMYFNLKCAAIKAISLEEYYEFFSRDAFPNDPNIFDTAFNIDIYYKIEPYLDKETRNFWNALYMKQTGIKIRKSSLFSIDEESVLVLPKINEYLTKEGFEKAKNILDAKVQTKFIKSNITRLPSKLTKNYDYILLSNIAQYLDKIYDKNQLLMFKKLITKLSNSLNANGKMMVSYLYTPKDLNVFNNNCENIYNISKVLEIFKEDNLQLLEFEAMYDLGRNVKSSRNDAALIYTKKN